jgi:hypothetical protein
MSNDYRNDDEEQDVKRAVTRMAAEASRYAPSTAPSVHALVREEDVYRRPEMSDFEERGTEAQVAQLYAALACSRGQFTPFTKTRRVEVRKNGQLLYPFEYAPMDVLLAATTPALSSNGLVVMMPFVTASNDTTRQLVIIAHAGGGRLVFKFEFCPASDEKTFGGQTTYLQRYCYRSVLTLAADGDLEEQPSRANEDSAKAEDIKRPNGSERIQLRNGKAQVAQTAPAPAPDNQDHLGEVLALARKVGLTKRSQVAEFVWQTLTNGQPFGLGDPFCSSLDEDQLEKCFLALTARLDQPSKSAGGAR